LVPQLRKELTAYLPEDGRLDELLFTPGDHAAASRDAKPLLLSNWRRRVWVPAVAASGIAPCTPYDGRRTFISLMIHAGATPVEVAAEVGHSNPRMIWERYATLFRAAQKVPKLPIAEQIARARKELARGRKRGNVPQMFPKSEAKALRRSPKAA
jgi:integrase